MATLASHNFHHITDSERREAVAMWNDFNRNLEAKGMRLMYDYRDGGFYVCSTDLIPATESSERNLTDNELEQVVTEGGFRWTEPDGSTPSPDSALNNPPWFTDGVETLAVV